MNSNCYLNNNLISSEPIKAGFKFQRNALAEGVRLALQSAIAIAIVTTSTYASAENLVDKKVDVIITEGTVDINDNTEYIKQNIPHYQGVVNINRYTKGVTINIANDKTLTLINDAVPKTGGTQGMDYVGGTVILAGYAAGQTLTIEGGNLVGIMSDTTVNGMDGSNRSFYNTFIGSQSTVTFRNKSVLFKGSVAKGFSLNGSSDTNFVNGFTMQLNRTKDTQHLDQTQGICGSAQSILRFGGPANIELTLGANDSFVQGVYLQDSSRIIANGILNVIVDGNDNSSLGYAYGYLDIGRGPTSSFSENVYITTKNAPDCMAVPLLLYPGNTYTFTKDLVINVDSVKKSYGIMSSRPIVAKNLNFNIHNIKEQAVAIALDTGGKVTSETLVANMSLANNASPNTMMCGIHAENRSSVVLENAYLTFADGYASVIESDNSSINIKGDFKATCSNCVIASENNSDIKINSSQTGVIAYKGSIKTQTGAKTHVFLGNPLNENEGNSFWDITDKSTITDLKMGNKSFLNFTISNANKADFQNRDEATGDRVAMLNVTGNNPVVLYDDGINGRRTRITLTLDGPVELNDGDELNLITSNAGFVLNDAPIDENTPLYRLRGLFKVKQNYSLVRTTTDDLGLGYKLGVDFLTGGILHVYATVDSSYATIDPDGDGTPSTPLVPLVPATPRINPETDILMESSLSSYGTLAAADDLMVDTVLRSRNGGHEGAFAAARAGRWHFDTSASQKSNITSGLFGYAVQTSVAEVGGWLEIGNASYKVNTNVDDVTTAGSGKHNYVGVGAYANVPMPLEGWFLTGYLKAGALENNFDTVLTDQAVNFDRTSGYWGAHLGTHYDLTVGDFRLRPFVSYFYDGRDSESYSFNGHGKVQGATFHYDKLNAHRVQAGTFAEYRYSEQQRPYIGLTYEQVLSAKAKGYAVDGYGRLGLNSSDMEGGTGILSAGWTYVNQPKSFSCEFGMNGFAGTRRGVSAQIQADWRF